MYTYILHTYMRNLTFDPRYILDYGTRQLVFLSLAFISFSMSERIGIR